MDKQQEQEFIEAVARLFIAEILEGMNRAVEQGRFPNG